MPFVSPRMSLKIWNAASDPYDHEQLADNWLKVDLHDHSQGRGTPIPTAGIQDGAVTAQKIAPGTIAAALGNGSIKAQHIDTGAVISGKLGPTAVDTANIAYGAVKTDQLDNSSVTSAKIGPLQVTNAKMATDSVATANIIDGNVTTAKISQQAKADLMQWVTIGTCSTSFVPGATTGWKMPAASGGTLAATYVSPGVLACETRPSDGGTPWGIPLQADVMPGGSTTGLACKIRVRTTVMGSITSPGLTFTSNLVNATYRLSASNTDSIPMTLTVQQQAMQVTIGAAHFDHYVSSPMTVAATGLYSLVYNINANVAASSSFGVWSAIQMQVDTA